MNHLRSSALVCKVFMVALFDINIHIKCQRLGLVPWFSWGLDGNRTEGKLSVAQVTYSHQFAFDNGCIRETQANASSMQVSSHESCDHNV